MATLLDLRSFAFICGKFAPWELSHQFVRICAKVAK